MKHPARKTRDERGAEAVAMMIVIPVLVVLVLALIDVGMMFRARMLVENVYRDAARGAAATGGNYWARTMPDGQGPWDQWAYDRLWDGSKCRIAACKPDAGPPTIDCDIVTSPDGTTRMSRAVAPAAGWLITCEGHYPYKPINSALLNGPLGLGFGKMLKEFDVSVSARAETGENSAFG